MIINGKNGLIKHLKKYAPKSIKKKKPNLDHQEICIYRKTFRGLLFNGDLTAIDLKRCKFIDCEFKNIWGFFLILENCQFIDCQFYNSRFSHLEFCWSNVEFFNCFFRNVQFDEGAFFDISFDKCEFIMIGFLGFFPVSNLLFNKCKIENGLFQTIVYYKNDDEIDNRIEDIIIQECSIESSHFIGVDFVNSKVVDSSFFDTAFTSCRFGVNSIYLTKETQLPNYASIDFQTILKSETIEMPILKKYFNINDPNYKITIGNITTEIKFKTVFISYSFKDRVFANHLNEGLRQQGVRTFLWEKDAPAGTRLDEIMSKNVRANDRLLFIASEDSIKSTACQYELSEGRKKQEETWESLFFPIHIDNYLFKVTKNQIRPLTSADEYWANIEEIKRLNSIDFSAFNQEKFDLNEFTTAIGKIVKELM